VFLDVIVVADRDFWLCNGSETRDLGCVVWVLFRMYIYTSIQIEGIGIK